MFAAFCRFSLKFTKRFAQLIEGRDRHHIRLNFVYFILKTVFLSAHVYMLQM